MKNRIHKLFFPIIGFLSLVWFLIRVIPKPSRASYPCMRATAPIAWSFVVWATGLFASALFFRKARNYLIQSRYLFFFLAFVTGLLLFLIPFLQDSRPIHAFPLAVTQESNQPMGIGQGIFPGRVVWIHDPAATDETCKNSANDYWYQNDNTDQNVVNQMLAAALQNLTGTMSDTAAWDALFRYYNTNHGKGDVGYSQGEKIVIKINLNGYYNTWTSQPDRNINTSPQICYAVLDQLVNVVGVAQADISIGDPNVDKVNPQFNKCSLRFPEVKYWGTGSGRTPAVPSDKEVLFSSDGQIHDVLPQSYLDAAYMINIPVLKKHQWAGISLCSKNHFGSTAPYYGGASHWHYSLPRSTGTGAVDNGEYGVYRCFVDLMGHKDLGGKTILFLVDGLWGSVNWGHPPVKWRMAPFNNDWPSSLFLSQDPVAIESVGFDFLYCEFDEKHPSEGIPVGEKGPFPHFPGTDDFLHQAADARNWPKDLSYDPEHDGTPLPSSMGTHEHWNNAGEKKYSRNLGFDEGIELVTVEGASSAVKHPHNDRTTATADFILEQNYPNPFNASTAIVFKLYRKEYARLCVYNTLGQPVATLVDQVMDAGSNTVLFDASAVPSGVYYYKLITPSGIYARKAIFIQ